MWTFDIPSIGTIPTQFFILGEPREYNIKYSNIMSYEFKIQEYLKSGFWGKKVIKITVIINSLDINTNITFCPAQDLPV